MPRIYSKELLVALAVGLLGLAGRAGAVPLGLNTSVAGTGEADPTGGVVQAGTGVAVPFASPAGPGQFSGTLTTTVIAGDPSNTLGGLTFTYRLTNDAGSLAALERMTNLNFTGFLTDVSYQTPATGVIPTTVDRDAGGSTVGWDFNPLGSGFIAPGGASALLVIQTNAPSYEAINANIIDGNIATAPSFGPVPEPASLTLIAIGLAAATGRRRRQV